MRGPFSFVFLQKGKMTSFSKMVVRLGVQLAFLQNRSLKDALVSLRDFSTKKCYLAPVNLANLACAFFTSSG